VVCLYSFKELQGVSEKVEPLEGRFESWGKLEAAAKENDHQKEKARA